MSDQQPDFDQIRADVPALADLTDEQIANELRFAVICVEEAFEELKVRADAKANADKKAA